MKIMICPIHNVNHDCEPSALDRESPYRQWMRNPFCGSVNADDYRLTCMKLKDHDGAHRAFGPFSITVATEWDRGK